MLGVDDSPASLGVIPCAIDWLFRLIGDQKEQTGARFSVRVSAVEITGKDEHLRDLLADTATGKRHCTLHADFCFALRRRAEKNSPFYSSGSI